MSHLRTASGFTLLELVIVLAILIVLAATVVPLVALVSQDSAAVATASSMNAVRAAIVGSPGQAGYLTDVGQLPTTVADLFVMPANVTPFNPLTRTGWRGPYLLTNPGTYSVNAGNGFVSVPGSNGESVYGVAGDPAVFDGWGRPIVIQAPMAGWTATSQRDQFTRLVSAGPDGIIETPASQLYPTTAQRGDDVVLFLLRADVSP